MLVSGKLCFSSLVLSRLRLGHSYLTHSYLLKGIKCFEKHILIVKNKTMSIKTVKFNKKKHKGNDWMTDDLLDLINLKNRLYKEFKQTPTQHVDFNSRKTNLQTCQRIYKRNKDSVKRDYYYKLFHKYKSDIKIHG